MLLKDAKKLDEISPRSWEHPADTAALSVLRGVAGLDDIVRMIVGGTMEKSIRLLHLANTVKVTANQFPVAYQILQRVAEILDWPQTPDMFVTNDPFFNAGVVGVKEPFIVLHSALIKTLDERELACVIAHELGHIMSGHSVYKTVLWLLLRISLAALPIAGLLVKPILLALKEWDRKSELTADRAALVAVQSEQENYNVLMKGAGGGDLSQMNMNDFFQQAWEYDNQKSLLDSLFKLLNTLQTSHPFPVVRLQELRTWAASGEYQAILAGRYVRRSDPAASTADDVKNGYEHYKTALRNSDDPLARAARTVGDSLGKAADGLRDALKDVFKGQ
jgi:Zn-dependent protease with chaperone function